METLNSDDYNVIMDNGIYELIGTVFVVHRDGKAIVLLTNVRGNR